MKVFWDGHGDRNSPIVKKIKIKIPAQAFTIKISRAGNHEIRKSGRVVGSTGTIDGAEAMIVSCLRQQVLTQTLAGTPAQQ